MKLPEPDWYDDLRDWWDEEETVSVESCFPIVARLLDCARREGKANAMREAAGELDFTPLVDPLNLRDDIVEWLHARADRIEASR